MNTVVVKPEGLTSLIPKPAILHDPELVPLPSYPNKLCPSLIIMLSSRLILALPRGRLFKFCNKHFSYCEE